MKTRRSPLALALSLALCALGAAPSARHFVAAAAAAEAPAGPVVLTIAGKVAAANRGPLQPLRDGFLNYHGISFDKAFALDRDMLAGLPQTELRVVTQQAGEGLFTGPRLADVLKLAGAEGAGVRLMALDGYAIELSAEDIAAKEWILALSQDGRPFGLGDLGPVWLMHKPSSGDAPTEEEAQKWIWSVFYIEVT